MDLNYKQQATVGALVIIATLLFIAGALWLGGKSLGRGGDLTRIEFDQVGLLKEGHPVLISGVNRGKVAQIRLLEPGRVMVLVSLAKEVEPKSDASARIISLTALGETAIAFQPGTSASHLAEGAVIRGTTEASLTERVAAMGDRADSVLLGAQELVSKRTADDLHATMVAMQRVLNTLADRLPAPTQEATRAMMAVRQLSERLDSTLANPGFNRGLSNMDSVTANLAAVGAQLSRTTASLDTFLANINRGQGTLGKLASDSGLYNDLRATMQSMKAFLDEIKRDPGKITVQFKVF